MAFEVLPISANRHSICGYISVLKFRWSAYGETDWTGNIYLSSTFWFHQIRHKIQVNCTEKWIQFFRSSENEQVEIWFHMKKVPIYEDICTRLLYFDIVCWPETTGNSNCEKMLTWDHWEFQLWKATWHDSQELDFVQREKENRFRCRARNCLFKMLHEFVPQCFLYLIHVRILTALRIFFPELIWLLFNECDSHVTMTLVCGMLDAV
jgi:hypothetical protein